MPAKKKYLERLPISIVEIPQGYLPRTITQIHKPTVEEYARLMEEGEKFPPPRVWKRPDGRYWLIDGVHRIEALRKIGRKEVEAEVVEGIDESEYEVMAFRANLKHGLPLKREEKKQFLERLFFKGYKPTEIAKKTGIPLSTVRRYLAHLLEKEKKEREKLLKEAKELAKKGIPIARISEQTGIPRSTLSMKLKEEAQKKEEVKEVIEKAKTVISSTQEPNQPTQTFISQPQPKPQPEPPPQPRPQTKDIPTHHQPTHNPQAIPQSPSFVARWEQIKPSLNSLLRQMEEQYGKAVFENEEVAEEIEKVLSDFKVVCQRAFRIHTETEKRKKLTPIEKKIVEAIKDALKTTPLPFVWGKNAFSLTKVLREKAIEHFKTSGYSSLDEFIEEEFIPLFQFFLKLENTPRWAKKHIDPTDKSLDEFVRNYEVYLKIFKKQRENTADEYDFEI